MPKSYENQKNLIFEITYGLDDEVNEYLVGPQENPDTKIDKITISGMRASVDIYATGIYDASNSSSLSARIYGLSPDAMARCSSLNNEVAMMKKNSIVIYAVDGDVKSLIFAGNIYLAWADYSMLPQTFLRIEAQSLYFARLAAQTPSSFKGEVNAATVIETIAYKMGYAFENNGVTTKLRDVAVTGSYKEQADAIAQMAGINMSAENGVVAIWPKDGSRSQYTLKIGRDTGMVGYPTFLNAGISTNIIYHPNATVGGEIEMITDVYGVYGVYYITSLRHMLDSNTPNGRWYTQINALRGNQVGK